MKKGFFLTLLVLEFAFQFSYAQWTTSGSDIYNSNSGNVGIGTTNPTAKLHISGTIKASSITIPGTGTNSEKIGSGASAAGTNGTAIGYNADAGNDVYNTSIGSSATISSGKYYSTVIGSNASSSYSSTTVIGAFSSATNNSQVVIGSSNSTPAAYVSVGAGANGGALNIGANNNSTSYSANIIYGQGIVPTINNGAFIGNADPGWEVHDFYVGMGQSSSSVAYAGSAFTVNYRTTDGSGTNVPGVNMSFRPGRGTGSAAGGKLSFWTTPTGSSGTILNAEVERMTITSDGNIGIGTTDPQGYKLAVDGDAIFTKMKVKTYASWPDYVFHRNYNLRPLMDLEKYIKQNGHLPDVPSASEVEKNGLDVGDNQATLLKKIEELTIYIIDINKKVDKLSKENEMLKKKVAAGN
jgi:hypothetical protein